MEELKEALDQRVTGWMFSPETLSRWLAVDDREARLRSWAEQLANEFADESGTRLEAAAPVGFEDFGKPWFLFLFGEPGDRIVSWYLSGTLLVLDVHLDDASHKYGTEVTPDVWIDQRSK